MRALTSCALLLALLLPACAAQPEPTAQPAPERVPAGGATVSIENQTAFDMDIYVQRRGSAIRLGFAPAKQTTRFTLAPGLLAGAGIIQFSARPSRGGESTASDPFTVAPGDELTWKIPG